MSILQAPNILVIQLKVCYPDFWFTVYFHFSIHRSLFKFVVLLLSCKGVVLGWVWQRFEGIFGGKIDKAIAYEESLQLSNFMCKGSQVRV